MSETTNIIDVTETEFNDQVIEASENKLIVVDFWAPWCGPCKQLTPILEKIISKSRDKIKPTEGESEFESYHSVLVHLLGTQDIYQKIAIFAML